MIDKIVKNQLDRNIKPTLVEEKRVSDDIEKGLTEEIKTIVQRSMERAIADEILEQVQVEKLSRTPTVEPELAREHALSIALFKCFKDYISDI